MNFLVRTNATTHGLASAHPGYDLNRRLRIPGRRLVGNGPGGRWHCSDGNGKTLRLRSANGPRHFGKSLSSVLHHTAQQARCKRSLPKPHRGSALEFRKSRHAHDATVRDGCCQAWLAADAPRQTSGQATLYSVADFPVDPRTDIEPDLQWRRVRSSRLGLTLAG